jgi:hypothetical protein
MAETFGTCVIYYPPTTGHPPTWSSHSLRSLQSTPFDSEEAAEAFIERDAPRLPS